MKRTMIPLLTALATLTIPVASAAPLEINKGDHISIIGNTLADRMQHDGWLEAYLHSRFPRHDLVIRNLGFSGDEIPLPLRLRSAGFGSPDHWLSANRTDVLFAFFGYNESYAGEAGLAKFKKDIDDFLKATLKQTYNGQTPPRVVLFSPIAHEDLKDRNLPDGKDNNKRLELYTAAIAEAARTNHVAFIDLFGPSRQLYKKAAHPLTINGIHPNSEGNRQLADVIDKTLFADGRETKHDPDAIEKIRHAVLEKNFYWFNRYRTVDGYSMYGGRADLSFVEGQTNRVVAQRELEILDVMTSNRDKRIWAVARGGDLKLIDDSNTPDFIPVKTNKPGKGPNGEHIYQDGADAIKNMNVAKGMKVNLFASEKEFPELVNPVQMTFDARGRLWVAVWPTYPHWKPKEGLPADLPGGAPNDKLLVFEDTKGTGKADKMTVFADHLHCPTGFEFWNGGVLVAQAPDLMFLKDTKGTGKADVRERVLHGIDSADTHHTANSFTFDPGAGLYFQEGTFHRTQVETPYGPPQRCADAGVYRYEPRTQKFEVYISHGFANPHGHVFDHWGQDIVVDGTGADPYHAVLFSGRIEFPQKHSRPPNVYPTKGIRPCPGIETLSSRHFPPEMQGNLLVANVIGFQGIRQVKLRDEGSSFVGTDAEPILTSVDPNFRPSDLKIGPDGAIYFTDWQNPIIGHMQHNLRDPSRGRTHGRIYRVTYEGRELLKPVKIDGEPIDKLLDLLKEPEDRVRYRVRTELAARNTDEVIAAAKKWLDKLDSKDPEYPHHLLEVLWLHQSHNVVDPELLKLVLTSPDFHARAAATRVLCYWRDRVPGTLDLLRKLAADPHPRVRLEAIRAASFLTMPEAVEIPVIAAELDTDTYINFLRTETMRTLDPIWNKALADGRPINFTTDAGARFYLHNVSTDELIKKPRSRAVYLEMLYRKGVRDELRREAITGLAKLDGKSEMRVLFDALASQDDAKANRDESILFDMVRLLTGRTPEELAVIRPELEKMATAARTPLTRQLGFVALITADGSVDKAWDLAIKSVGGLRDLVLAMPLIRDVGLRASLYPKVEPLLQGLPKNLAATVGQGKETAGRFVRVELPGPQRTLTLAEVEVYSDGKNIARQGKASQKNTAHGGDASKAIDGNTNSAFNAGGQTHTQEGTKDPWWEVDLGGEFPIDTIVIYNRADGALGDRLNGFTLKVLDKRREVVFEKTKLPAPAVKSSFAVGSESPERIIRRAAMVALTSVRGQEGPTFKALALFVKEGDERPAALQALQRIPSAYWPTEEIKPLLDSLLTYVRKLPTEERTSPTALDALQLADALAGSLPLDDARKVRKELGDLGVRVIRLATVPDQMRYDQERIVVQAGKPFEIVFENTDLMPHNLVFLQPGALEETGVAGEAQATLPGAAERNYVPNSGKILLASRLLQPRESQKLSFPAPKKSGVYPYVCTYPGHWRRMYGSLYVVEDLDQYQAGPEAYLAKNPLPVVDELLKFNRPRKEWKYDDLVKEVEQMEHGRSFANARQMFQISSCISCHKMNGVGNEFGPDLMKLEPKWTRTDILKDILEPSFRINEKFQTFIFETKAGKSVTGLILEETGDAVKIIENPLAKTTPLVLKKSEIETRTKSPTSMMPKGLLDKLTREEILDLVAYIVARGDPKHKVFQGEHHH
jgi:putative heme-binding domain-containing protein